MENLKKFQENMPNGFDSIALDIVGFCNAKCKYCPAGNDLSHKNSFMNFELLEKILQKITEYKFFTETTNFHIYGLGEPCLHPQINKVLKLLSKYHISTSISTNASVVPDFEEESLRSVGRFLISVPGFSQSSYDRIHGFDFEKIKSNIIKLRTSVDELSDGKIPFDMSYHIYQFNEFEMVQAKEFCDQWKIRFAPNYAVLMDKDKCLDYVTGKMEYEELKDISKEIFLGVLDQQIKDAPRNYCDFQASFLSINVEGDVRICSGFRKKAEPAVLLGNIVRDNIDDILYRKFHHPRCKQCIDAGLTLAKGYECKVYPDGYYEIMKENEFIKQYVGSPNLSGKLTLMKYLREFEREGYSDSSRKKIVDFVDSYGLWPDVEEIALKYTRFSMKTYQKLINGVSV